MKEVVIGIRIDVETGIQFLGLDEVNKAIRQGERIASIEPGDLIVEQVEDEDGDIQLALSGGHVRVLFE